jgi:hypothetical protein
MHPESRRRSTPAFGRQLPDEGEAGDEFLRLLATGFLASSELRGIARRIIPR